MLLIGGVKLHDHVIGMHLPEGIARTVAYHMFAGTIGKELECADTQAVAAGRVHLHQVFHGRQGQQHDVGFHGRIRQSDFGFHHQTERAFRTNHQMTQVIAAGVLHQATIEIEQFSAAGDQLEAGNPLARVAIADHADSAGIGGDVAADGTGTARGEIDRVIQTLLARRVLKCFQGKARLNAQQAVNRIKPKHAVHALEAQHQFAVGCHRATGQSGTPARGNDTDPVLDGPTHDFLDFRNVGWQRDGQRRRRPAARPVATVKLEVGGIRFQAQRGQPLAQT